MRLRKGTSLCETAFSEVFCVRIGAGILAVGDWKNQKTIDGVKVLHSKWFSARSRVYAETKPLIRSGWN